MAEFRFFPWRLPRSAGFDGAWVARAPVVRSFFWQTVGFGAIFMLRERGINHIDRFVELAAVLAVIIALMLRTNPDMRDYLAPCLRGRRWWRFAALYGLVVVLYSLTPVNGERLAALHNLHFAYFQYPYLVSKTLDIGFQQLAFGMFVFDLLHRRWPLGRISLLSAALLGVSHLATLASLPWPFACVFIAGGVAAGLAFPWLIAGSRGGFSAAFCAHWGYYLALGLVVNLS